MRLCGLYPHPTSGIRQDDIDTKSRTLPRKKLKTQNYLHPQTGEADSSFFKPYYNHPRVKFSNKFSRDYMYILIRYIFYLIFCNVTVSGRFDWRLPCFLNSLACTPSPWWRRPTIIIYHMTIVFHIILHLMIRFYRKFPTATTTTAFFI